MAGISTVGIKLYYKKDKEYTEIADILEVPELGGKPEKIDTTTLGDKVKKSINGVKDLGDLEFSLLYDNSSVTANYRILKALADANSLVSLKVEYPDKTGHAFDAYISVSMDAAKVNDKLAFKMSCALQTEITVTNPQ